MALIKLRAILDAAKHWGGFAGALSLVVVVMQNVFQKSELANQDRVHQLEMTIKEAQSDCLLLESSVKATNVKFKLLSDEIDENHPR